MGSEADVDTLPRLDDAPVADVSLVGEDDGGAGGGSELYTPPDRDVLPRSGRVRGPERGRGATSPICKPETLFKHQYLHPGLCVRRIHSCCFLGLRSNRHVVEMSAWRFLRVSRSGRSPCTSIRDGALWKLRSRKVDTALGRAETSEGLLCSDLLLGEA